MLKEIKVENSWFLSGAKNILLCFALTIAVLFVISVISVFANLQAAAVSLMVSVVTYLCVGVCGFRAARKTGSNGLLAGALSGFLYAVVLYLIGAVAFSNFSVNTSTLLTVLICVLCGGVGGVVGVNMKMKKRR